MAGEVIVQLRQYLFFDLFYGYLIVGLLTTHAFVRSAFRHRHVELEVGAFLAFDKRIGESGQRYGATLHQLELRVVLVEDDRAVHLTMHIGAYDVAPLRRPRYRLQRSVAVSERLQPLLQALWLDDNRLARDAQGVVVTQVKAGAHGHGKLHDQRLFRHQLKVRPVDRL